MSCSVMTERLYDDLADWWPLLSPPEHYADDVQRYLALLREAVDGELGSLLDLGAGGGSVSHNLPATLEVVLVDRSERMLAVSRSRNPGRQHVCADMRTLRLDRTFDAVLLHDAVMYLTAHEDLVAAFTTAAAHLRPGGALLVAPDVVVETFQEGVDVGGGSDGDRALQMLEWQWDPDPGDTTFQAEFAFILREGHDTRVVHDRHTMALYDHATYVRALQAAGLELVPLDPMDLMDLAGEVFLARRP